MSDAADELVRRHVFVSGRVQGVGFRAACASTARAAGVAGWVRNTPDGRVEAVFEGEERAVAGVVRWCGSGDTPGRVERVETNAETPVGEVGFGVR